MDSQMSMQDRNPLPTEDESPLPTEDEIASATPTLPAPPMRMNAGRGRSVLSWALDAEPGALHQAQRTARQPRRVG